MPHELAIRLMICLVIIGTGWMLYWLTNRLILAHSRSRVYDLADYHQGLPAILYFTTPNCGPCKTFQGPVIQSLKNQLGDGLQVIEVDASIYPKLADKWGVMSVPTTFLIDARGRPRVVNHGLVTKEKLFQQLRETNQ